MIMETKETISFWGFNERATKDGIEKEILENPKAYLDKKMSNKYDFGTMGIMQGGLFKMHAWAYDFRPFLKKYVYKQYGNWHESYALNKTNLRKLIGGRIDKILDAE